MTKILTNKVRAGLDHIDAFMRADIDTMEDRPDEVAEIVAALDWIDYQVSRCDRNNGFRRMTERHGK